MASGTYDVAHARCFEVFLSHVNAGSTDSDGNLGAVVDDERDIICIADALDIACDRLVLLASDVLFAQLHERHAACAGRLDGFDEGAVDIRSRSVTR